MTPADPDILAMPDPASLTQLPWKPEVGWLAADLVMARQAGAAGAARRAEGADRQGGGVAGYQMKSGVECEFFLLTPDGNAIADLADRTPSPATTSPR